MPTSKSGFEIEIATGAGVRGTQPVDLAHLGRYTMGDRMLEHEILMLFIQQAPATIDRLRHAETERQWREAGHTLKGSSRAVGAWRLAQVAEAAERNVGWSVAAIRKAALEQIMLALAEVQDFIARLPQASAA